MQNIINPIAPINAFEDPGRPKVNGLRLII